MAVGKILNTSHPIIRVLAVQVCVPVVLAAVLLLVSAQAAYSALLGGAVCVVANMIVAYGVFPQSGRRSSIRIVQRFFWAEGTKYVVSIVLMAVLFKSVSLNALAFFGSYLLSQCVFWLAPLLTKPIVGAASV